MTRKKAKIALKYALSGLWWALLLIGGVCTAIFLSAHLRGEIPQIGGYSVMHIVSPSMEPTIETNSYILIKRVDPTEIAQNDVICFYSTDPNIYGYPNTHRVVEEPYEENGKLLFTTKGDRNPLPDNVPAEGERLIGVYVKNLGILTAFLRFLTQHFMVVLLFLVLLGAGCV